MIPKDCERFAIKLCLCPPSSVKILHLNMSSGQTDREKTEKGNGHKEKQIKGTFERSVVYNVYNTLYMLGCVDIG